MTKTVTEDMMSERYPIIVTILGGELHGKRVVMLVDEDFLDLEYQQQIVLTDKYVKCNYNGARLSAIDVPEDVVVYKEDPDA